MTLMDDESAARLRAWPRGRARRRQPRTRRASPTRGATRSAAIFGAMLGSVVGGGIGSAVAQMSQQRAQLATLSFSREQEYQADMLGTRYLVAAGYDPAGGPGSPRRARPRERAPSARPGPRQPPDSGMGEHPPAEREPHAARACRRPARPAASAPACATATSSSRSSKASIVDDDPAQGIIEGRTFTHPDLRIQFAVPQGYLMQNGTTRGVDQRLGRARRSSAAAATTAASRITSARCFQQLTGGQAAADDPAAAADDDQRHPGGLHDRPRQHLVRRRRRQRRSPISGTRTRSITS